MSRLPYLLFFCSGLAGLIYQVAWVRVFGNVFGNTIYSASMVVAVFMLGLGVGSYVAGRWADRRYSTQPESLLRAYAWAELIIACFGGSVAVLLPYLGQISAAVSWYTRDANGWYVLSAASHVARAVIAIVLLAPATLIMGGTLTLLVRHFVRRDVALGSRRTAVIYGVNTAGAAVGCFLTDFLLVPAAGLRAAQFKAVVMNLVAAAGAFAVTWRPRTTLAISTSRSAARGGSKAAHRPQDLEREDAAAGERASSVSLPQSASSLLAPTSLALALTGFAGMGMEILWLRHFSLLLGEFRAVFSLLLGVILVGMGGGALVGAFLHRRTARPAEWLIIAQGLWVVFVLLGLASADVKTIHAAALRLDPILTASSLWTRNLVELWFNAKPIVWEVAAPALLMGVAFPLGNAIVQRAEVSAARRAGMLYLSNTLGSVCGSLATGFCLLPLLGIQGTAAILSIAAALAIVPLHALSRRSAAPTSASPRFVKASLFAAPAIAVAAVITWLQLPSGQIIRRAQVLPENDATGRLLALSEGITEVVAVTETPGSGRALLTNGHPMAGTEPLGQRYMRALAHIPLLSLDAPRRVLVIGFGVGNTAHAATLHPSVRDVEVADLSRHVLAHGDFFRAANADVLHDARVSVFVNDGRQHLLMQPPGRYDLITLEPPPIAQSGVGALYSREFYTLARARLKVGGYISQWLPVYQVSSDATLAMVRAFVDVFPHAVLLSGAKADLLLVGVNGPSIEIDPARMATAVANAPAVQADLQRFTLGSVRELIGTFIGSARTLADASHGSAPATDDRPIQEYSVRSLLNTSRYADAPPPSLIDLTQLSSWCPRCFVDGRPAPLVEGIDTYFALLNQFYLGSVADRPPAPYGTRMIDGSAYLGAILPESAEVHDILGLAMLDRGQPDRAKEEFRDALRLDPASAAVHWHLGRTLASRRETGAIDHLRQAVELGPDNGGARYDLATALLEAGRDDEAMDHFRRALPSLTNAAVAYNTIGVGLVSHGRLAEAVDQFREAIRLKPTYVEAYNNLGTALAFQGKRDEALEQFQQALALQPAYAEARRNLAIVRRGVLSPRVEISGDASKPSVAVPNGR